MLGPLLHSPTTLPLAVTGVIITSAQDIESLNPDYHYRRRQNLVNHFGHFPELHMAYTELERPARQTISNDSSSEPIEHLIDVEGDYSDSEEEDDNTRGKLSNLEDLALDFLSQLCRAKKNSIPSSSSSGSETGDDAKSHMTRPRIQIELVNRSKRTTLGDSRTKSITFPRRSTIGSAKPLAQLFQVVNYMHEAILDEVPTTKRDMYYRDVPLFKSQRVVDNLVDDIAATLDMERSDLNVVSSNTLQLAYADL
ncbi:endodeoxyribonuclease [Marasmius tenuissimus]|nr:endodeoxyribonuclease [Marasmius tenuissimus]